MAKNFIWKAQQVYKKVEQQAERALTRGSILILNKAKALMKEPKSGEDYRGKGRGKKKGAKRFKTRSSAPGQAPAVQTGRLRASLAHVKPAPLTRHVGTNLAYGFFLEKGTKRGLAERPFLRPAFKSERPKIVKMLRGKL